MPILKKLYGVYNYVNNKVSIIRMLSSIRTLLRQRRPKKVCINDKRATAGSVYSVQSKNHVIKKHLLKAGGMTLC